MKDSNIKNVIFSFVLIIIFITFSACISSGDCGSGSSGSSVEGGEGTDTSETSSDDGSNGGASSLGFVTVLEKDSDTEAHVDLSDVEADSDYMLIVYSANYGQEDWFSYKVGTLPCSSSNSYLTKIINTENGVDAFQESLRELESELDGDLPEIDSYLSADVSEPELGSVQEFSMIANATSSSPITVEAKLSYISSNFYVYIDTRDLNTMSSSDLKTLMKQFDSVVPDERDLFGEESDVNEDDHFVVLMTQEVNKLGEMIGGRLNGYFYGADLYSAKVYEGSNEMEIFYTLVPDPKGKYSYPVSEEEVLEDILPEVLPHEFQHMISFNQHVFINGGESEVTFLNEALSHLAEDIYSLNQDGYMEQSGERNHVRVGTYLDYTDQTCFTCGSNTAERGGSYLFIRYLYEQAELGHLDAIQDGADLINRLMDTDLTGVSNIVDSVLESDDNNDFNKLMGEFSLALYLSDSGLTDDNHYQFQGIELDDVALYAISCSSYTGNLISSGVQFVQFFGSSLQQEGDELKIEIEDGFEIGGYLVEVK